MSSSVVEFLGLLGGFLTCSSIIPQIIKCYRTRSTKDLSWSMFAINYVGTFINISYGICIHHPAIYINATFSICTSTMLVYMKWQFDNNVSHLPAPAPAQYIQCNSDNV
ncbi:hypothetical protein [Dishui Lake large algae virus 1]|nr:hypothetical protein [Dishui Lake large algae virus 1]